jgi:hypothetical protein
MNLKHILMLRIKANFISATPPNNEGKPEE